MLRAWGAVGVISAILWCLPGLGLAGPACEAEIASACPDSPASEIGSCLKDPELHEVATTISSECTDFMALNVACAKEIEEFCEEAFFSADTALCLSKWTDQDNLSEKCKAVMKWAVSVDDPNQEVVTDELGMSEEDYAEKRAWQEKRKAARGDAIERMKMKERDAAIERERVALEKFNAERPEEYAEMLRQKEVEERQRAEVKRRERMTAAALERKKRQEAGEDEEEGPSTPASRKKPANKGSWLMPCLALVALTILGSVAFYGLRKVGLISASKRGASGKKKKRG